MNICKPYLFFLILFFFSCRSDDENSSYVNLYEEGEELLTGPLGVNSSSSNAFGFEIDGLNFQELGDFATGNSLFNQSWTSSPASTKARDGLGPTFNARACSKCHFKDGRGKPPVNGQTSKGFLLRISFAGFDQYGKPNPVPGYGNQIQDRANKGIPIEANVLVNYDLVPGLYPDGSTYELQKPNYSFVNESFGSLLGVQTSPRVAQQTIGLGLINALPDSEILRFEDEMDNNNDGISGRPNYVWNVEDNSTTLGKFGWKANVPTLKQQISEAFHGDMGLTSTLFQQNNCPEPQIECANAPNGGEPEVTNRQLSQVLLYQSMLAVPNRRNFRDERVLRGKLLFNELNCIACHATNLKTTSNAYHPILENIIIKPYSDFLLHDMGEDLADNRPDFIATGREWRTQPLWGIGLISTVNNHTNLLHDGRARNIEEAILWHGGEAEQSKQAFMNLSKIEREQLLSFINSL